MRNLRRFERTVFLDNELGIPWLKAFGRSRQTAARPGLEPHAHRDDYEVCLLESGRVDWLAEGELFSIGAGEIFITRPQERHGSQHAVIQPCELYWFQVSFKGAPPPGCTARQCKAIRRDFERKLPRVFPASAEIRGAFKRLLQECSIRQPFWQERAAALLWGLLIDLARARRLQSKAERAVSPEIAQAVKWMREHLDEDYSLEQLAGRFGYSAPHFQARFAREMSIPPGQFRMQSRLEEAKRRILKRERLTGIAYALGFSSSQYFATAFRRMVGLSPREYRRRSEGGASVSEKSV